MERTNKFLSLFDILIPKVVFYLRNVKLSYRAGPVDKYLPFLIQILEFCVCVDLIVSSLKTHFSTTTMNDSMTSPSLLCGFKWFSLCSVNIGLEVSPLSFFIFSKFSSFFLYFCSLVTFGLWPHFNFNLEMDHEIYFKWETFERRFQEARRVLESGLTWRWNLKTSVESVLEELLGGGNSLHCESVHSKPTDVTDFANDLFGFWRF